jgi:acyl-coenzyme A synthetase/AMP-(fatty) acid ligase
VLGKGSKLTREGVLSLFNGELARFKHPRDVIFSDVLPRNVMGKVLKFELRDMVSQRNSG